MDLVYSPSSPEAAVVEAVAFVNGLTDVDEFWGGIGELKPFKQLDDPKYTPALIAQRMRMCTDRVTVLHYTDSGSTATAYVDPARPFCIFSIPPSLDAR